MSSIQKIDGWKKNEVEYLLNVAKSEKPLLSCFKEVADALNRKEGSVRNFYYQFLKKHSGEYNDITEGVRTVTMPEKFVEREAKDLISKVLAGQAKGFSVRRILMQMSTGDIKLFVRLQNKYRNTVSKNKVLVSEVMKDLERRGIIYNNPYALLAENGSKTVVLISEAEKLIHDAHIILASAKEIIEEMKNEPVVSDMEKELTSDKKRINELQSENQLLKSKIKELSLKEARH